MRGIWACMAIAIVMTLAPWRAASAADVTGVPRIVSADRVQIGNARIRLSSIEAPSPDQLCLDANGKRWTCGISARDELARHVGAQSWTCHITGTNRFGRSLAQCTVEGEDIQRWLVQNGWALSFIRQPHAYDGDEQAARTAKAGLWAGAFIAPSAWRIRNRQAPVLGMPALAEGQRRVLMASASGPVAPSPVCRIKGNVNRSGNCIFHQPSSRWYAQIRMSVDKGTRWFCSVDEAKAAGCRETRR